LVAIGRNLERCESIAVPRVSRLRLLWVDQLACNINFLARINKSVARQRPTSSAWATAAHSNHRDPREKKNRKYRHLGRSWSKGSTPGERGKRVLPSRSAAVVYMLEEFVEHDPPASRADCQTLLRWA
jgi:hypothetical protein